MLSGDAHTAFVCDLKRDFDDDQAPVIAAEFCGISITSRGRAQSATDAIVRDNPHIRFFESRLRGYTRCTVIRDRWYADLRVVDTVERPGAPVRTLASYVTETGRPGAERV